MHHSRREPPRREPPQSRPSLEPKRSQWYLISEDHSLSLRLVSGAILCEGQDGELVVSAQDAAHAARFDVIEDELWLSCLSGHIRADGRLISQHYRVEPGVQLQIGVTRYFVADSLIEKMPEIPVLQDRLEAADVRLPKPGGRHFPVFYEGPLEIEEIIISEPVSLDAKSEHAVTGDSETRTAGTIAATDVRSASKTPARTTSTARGRLLTVPAILGLGAALAYGGYQLIDSRSPDRIATRTNSTAPAQSTEQFGAVINTSAESEEKHVDDSSGPPTMNEVLTAEFSHLAWADAISTVNHQRLLTLMEELESSLLEPENRDSVERYADRLLGIEDVRQLESLVLSFGRAVVDQPAWRDILTQLESRVINLSRQSTANIDLAKPPVPAAPNPELSAISLAAQGDAGL